MHWTDNDKIYDNLTISLPDIIDLSFLLLLAITASNAYRPISAVCWSVIGWRVCWQWFYWWVSEVQTRLCRVVSCPGIEWRAAAQTPETRLSSVLTSPPLSLSLSLSLISSSRILPSSSPFYACCCCWWWWCTGRLGKDEWLIAITIAHSACAIVVVIWYNSCIAPPSLVFAITYIHVRTPQYLCLSLMLNFTWIKLQTYSWRSRTCRRGHRVMQLNYKAERL